MSEVIEHGKTYHEIECIHCGCRFSYTGKDIERLFGTNTRIVKCPECGKNDFVGEKE